MQNRLWVFVFALLSASCAYQRQPDISYFCEATLANENGEFTANPNEAEWKYDLGDGTWAIVHLPHAWQSAESFRAVGFDNTLDAPQMVIRFDRRFNRNDWLQTPPRLVVMGQISVGGRGQTQWVSNLHTVVFTYSAWNDLLAEDGDMEVTLYEAESRSVLQGSTIPRRALESIEATLQRLSAEVAEMEGDAQNRCEELEEEDMTLT